MSDFLGPLVDKHTDQLKSWVKWALAALIVFLYLCTRAPGYHYRPHDSNTERYRNA